jgi:hypothetical protein
MARTIVFLALVLLPCILARDLKQGQNETVIPSTPSFHIITVINNCPVTVVALTSGNGKNGKHLDCYPSNQATIKPGKSKIIRLSTSVEHYLSTDDTEGSSYIRPSKIKVFHGRKQLPRTSINKMVPGIDVEKCDDPSMWTYATVKPGGIYTLCKPNIK